MRKNSLKRGGNLYVIILYSKPVKPHFPTTPADFEAETPKKKGNNLSKRDSKNKIKCFAVHTLKFEIFA